MKLKQQKNVTALYCRYSKDEDYHSGNSMSIRNQKAMLETYANEKGFGTTEFYIDDGFTGTNYERPAFKRMIADIENGTVGTVIVKDLSRLGREYLQTGYYTEIYFPQNDVRCIAINDGFDSDIGENEFAPFRNIINEWYTPLPKIANKPNAHKPTFTLLKQGVVARLATAPFFFINYITYLLFGSQKFIAAPV